MRSRSSADVGTVRPLKTLGPPRTSMTYSVAVMRLCHLALYSNAMWHQSDHDSQQTRGRRSTFWSSTSECDSATLVTWAAPPAYRNNPRLVVVTATHCRNQVLDSPLL